MQENIIDEKSIRDKLSSRIDILNKVKNILAYIPSTTGSTIQAVNNTFAAMCRKYKTTVTEMIKDFPKVYNYSR